jgi:hypothetical protein
MPVSFKYVMAMMKADAVGKNHWSRDRIRHIFGGNHESTPGHFITGKLHRLFTVACRLQQ